MTTKLHSLAFAALLFVTLPLASSSAEVDVSITVGPPLLPVVVQPPCPVEGYLWTPGYWAYETDYYWVPGVWVPPPEVGLLWTPPWWGFGDGVYIFHEGFWGPTVGFYGGINYGFGYFGRGFVGGVWEGNVFRYNTAVTRVNTTIIHNTFVDRTVLRQQRTAGRASFNGQGGVKAEATAEEKAEANARHLSATSEQLSRKEAASKNRDLHASVNHGHPNAGAIKSLEPKGEGAQATIASEKSAHKVEHGARTETANMQGKAEHLHVAEHKHTNVTGPHHGMNGTARTSHHATSTMPHHPPPGASGKASGGQQRKGKQTKPGKDQGG